MTSAVGFCGPPLRIAALAEIGAGRAQRDHLGVARAGLLEARGQRAQHFEGEHVALGRPVDGDGHDRAVAA